MPCLDFNETPVPEMLFRLEPTVSVDNMVKLLFIINPQCACTIGLYSSRPVCLSFCLSVTL